MTEKFTREGLGGRPVTVCIAAIGSLESQSVFREHCIVAASDAKLTIGDASTDNSVVKLEAFHQNWTAMQAGLIGNTIQILGLARRNFEGKENTLSNAISALKSAQQERLVELQEDQVLRRYSLDLGTFLRKGKGQFTETVFGRLCDRIEKVKTKCDLLAYGFDADVVPQPHIFTVSDDGDMVHDKPGFACIGAGGGAANVMLYHLDQTTNCSLERTTYNVLAAKFFAERATDVGQKTFLVVAVPNSWSRPDEGLIKKVRQVWDVEGRPKCPPDIEVWQETLAILHAKTGSTIGILRD